MINLLPSLEKKRISEDKRTKKILIVWLLTFSFFLFVGLGFFSINIYLEQKISGLEKRIHSEEGVLGQAEVEDVRQKISKTNRLLSELRSFYQKKVYFSVIFNDIFEIMPGEVYLTDISLTRDEKEEMINVLFSGFSPTREKLFDLKTNIEAREDFQEASFPPSNWVKPNDIDFSANFKIPIKKL